MPLLHLATPHWKQPRARLAVRDVLRPIGGIQPGGFGLEDTLGGSFTIGSGITLADTRGEARSVDFTGANTGLTKAVSYTDHPFSLVAMARTASATNPQYIGSIATTADKLVRVWFNGVNGSINAQHLGATTNAIATAPQVAALGDMFSVVAVFRSPTDVRVYARGSNRSGAGIALLPQVVTVSATTNVGALGTLNKFAVGLYDGSVKTGQFAGQIFMAEWLRCALDPAQAWDFLNNPWAVYDSAPALVPFDTPAAAFNAAWASAANSAFASGARAA